MTDFAFDSSRTGGRVGWGSRRRFFRYTDSGRQRRLICVQYVQEWIGVHSRSNQQHAPRMHLRQLTVHCSLALVQGSPHLAPHFPCELHHLQDPPLQSALELQLVAQLFFVHLPLRQNGQEGPQSELALQPYDSHPTWHFLSRGSHTLHAEREHCALLRQVAPHADWQAPFKQRVHDRVYGGAT